MPAHRTHSGIDSTATPRRHQRAPRQPTRNTAAARPLIAIHNHSVVGAGSPATPSEVMYQRDSAVTATAAISATGSTRLSQLRARHWIATISTSNARP